MNQDINGNNNIENQKYLQEGTSNFNEKKKEKNNYDFENQLKEKIMNMLKKMIFKMRNIRK